MKKRTLTALATLALFANASIAEETKNFEQENTYFFIGYDLGGDDMGGLDYDDGSSSTVTSGGGFSLGGGVAIKSNKFSEKFNKNVGLYIEGSYKFDSATASNADVTMDRMIVAAKPYVQINEKVRLAVGLEYHMGVEYTEEIDGAGSDTIEFDPAMGLVAEAVIASEPDLVWSIKATSVEYTAAKLNNFDVSAANADFAGSNIGAYFRWQF